MAVTFSLLSQVYLCAFLCLKNVLRILILLYAQKSVSFFPFALIVPIPNVPVVFPILSLLTWAFISPTINRSSCVWILCTASAVNHKTHGYLLLYILLGHIPLLLLNVYFSFWFPLKRSFHPIFCSSLIFVDFDLDNHS